MPMRTTTSDNVVRDFLVSNSRIAQGYFELSGKIIDSLGEAPDYREALLTRLLDQTMAMTERYLLVHQQVLHDLYPSQTGTPAHLPAPAPEPAAPARAAGDGQRWLRAEISAITGAQPEALDLHQAFADLGVDSLSRVDLLDAMARNFPPLREHADAFFDLVSPADVLALLERPAASSGNEVRTRVLTHLASLTGFSINDLDPRQAYEEQGLDSLIRLDLLDLLRGEWPQLKGHDSVLAENRCAEQTIEQITRLLAAERVGETALAKAPPVSPQLQRALTLIHEGDANATDAERSFAELGLNGFDRAALCASLAQQGQAGEFAGEALMSRRTPQEVAALLARMSETP